MSERAYTHISLSYLNHIDHTWTEKNDKHNCISNETDNECLGSSMNDVTYNEETSKNSTNAWPNNLFHVHNVQRQASKSLVTDTTDAKMFF